MSESLSRWNLLPCDQAEREILPCCGSPAWAEKMVQLRPFLDEMTLFASSDSVWNSLSANDWEVAFRSHPRIGESLSPSTSQSREALTASWSAYEQRSVMQAGDDVKLALARGNREYEERFGRIFIVCATGKSPAEILEILQRRLRNEDAVELRQSAEQQRQIIQLRLKKWLAS
jgi:2-oxo-4-hydroxy-4-carboxy-5-ureidoimidazoline decarboxylase